MTEEGYRVYVEDTSVTEKIYEASKNLGIKVEVDEEHPSLEDAYTIAVMEHEVKGD